MSQDISITVPAPQQQAFSASLNTQVLHFKVIPSTDAPWITQIKDKDGDYQALNSLSLSFAPSADLTALNAEQKVVLIADLVSPADKDAAPALIWKFYQQGLRFAQAYDKQKVHIDTRLENEDTRLVMEISKVETAPAETLELAFSYTGIYYHYLTPSEPKVYYSQDPRVGIGRPKIPLNS